MLRPHIVFFCLLFALSIPFWILGFMVGDLTPYIKVKLPVSALMAFVPMLSATVLTYRSMGFAGVKALLNRSFDFQSLKSPGWIIFTLLIMPVNMIIMYWILRLWNMPLPDPVIPYKIIPIFLLAFSAGAIGEEVGWTGFCLPSMVEHGNKPVRNGLVIGGVWALWHIIPFYQVHPDLIWIASQSVQLIVTRVIMVWIFTRNDQSVLLNILFHTLCNVSMFLFPNYGSHYNPTIAAGILAIEAIALTVFIRTKDHSQVTKGNG